MKTRLLSVFGALAACSWVGCATPKTTSIAFLGIPESQKSDQGPVGLINGKSCQVRNVTAVSQTTYQQYQSSKRAGRVFVEETHGDYVYYAIKEHRDIRFDNASAWAEVIERFKARKP